MTDQPDQVYDEPEPDRYGHPRDGARDRDVDKGPEEIGWTRWIALRPYLAAYILLGLAFLAPLVLVSINYGRVSAQNDAIEAQNQSLGKQNDRLADVVRALQANRERSVRDLCEANNAQNTAIRSVLAVFHVDVNGSPRLKRAMRPLSISNCDAVVLKATPSPRLGP